MHTDTCSIQRRALGPLDLEIYAVKERPNMGSGDRTRNSARAVHTINCLGISPGRLFQILVLLHIIILVSPLLLLLLLALLFVLVCKYACAHVYLYVCTQAYASALMCVCYSRVWCCSCVCACRCGKDCSSRCIRTSKGPKMAVET